MKAYYCKDCKYYSQKLSSFKKHLSSQNHKNNPNILNNSNINDVNEFNDINNINNIGNINNSVEFAIDYEKYKKTLYCCKTCDRIYLSNQYLKNHEMNCVIDTKNIILEKENNMIKKENEKLKQKLEIEKKVHDKQINKMLDIARDNSKTANTSMNMLKYAKLYLNDVEPLEQLGGNYIYDVIKYNNPKGTEAINEQYVKMAIHKFNHNIFTNFIGDMIIEYYKPINTKNANVIATDTSRLCFIIMQKVSKGKVEKKEWINDKSGKKFTELVLEPLINAVKDTLMEFIEFKKTKELNENNLCLMGKCVELKRDIEVDKFIKPILKYVAPSFHFDRLKFFDEIEDQSVDSDNSEIKLSHIKIKSNSNNNKKT